MPKPYIIPNKRTKLNLDNEKKTRLMEQNRAS